MCVRWNYTIIALCLQISQAIYSGLNKMGDDESITAEVIS